MARKKIDLDEEAIWQAAARGASAEAIARALLDEEGNPLVTGQTIRRRYSKLIDQAKANGDIELYDALWEEGVIGVPDQNGNRKRNAAVLLRLAEHRLGMSQKMHQTNERQEFNIVIGPKPNTIPLEADDTSNNTIAGTDGLLEQ